MRRAMALLCIAAAMASLGCSEFDRMRIRAYLGGPDSQLLVGYAYETGQGVEQDPVEAVKWYRKAAEQGHPKAFGLLGDKYQHGVGVPVDLVQADMYYNLGLRRGESRLGDLIMSVERQLSAAEIAESKRLADAWDADH